MKFCRRLTAQASDRRSPMGVATGCDGGVTIEISEEMTLHAGDTARWTSSAVRSGPPASPVMSVWAREDAQALKVRGWCAWAVHPGAVAYVTGASW